MQSIDIYLGYLIFGLIFNHYKREDKSKVKELKLLDANKELNDSESNIFLAKYKFIVNKPKKL